MITKKKIGLFVDLSISITSFIVILNISNIVYRLFTLESAGIPELLLIFVNITAISFYLLFIKLIDSNLKQKNLKKYLSIFLGSIISMLIITFYLSNRFESKELMDSLKYDNAIYKSIINISSTLKNTKTVYKNTDELLKNLKGLDASQLIENKIEYNKISDTEFRLSWVYKTPEQEYKRSKLINRYGRFLMFLNLKDYKTGQNTKIYKIEKTDK